MGALENIKRKDSYLLSMALLTNGSERSMRQHRLVLGHYRERVMRHGYGFKEASALVSRFRRMYDEKYPEYNWNLGLMEEKIAADV